MRDNPNYVHVKMKGPTPPGTYKVTMRESLFHGVAAVRLTPVNGIAPHGRDGLLAHSYLLRNRGDSHGCVAFEEYPRFLKAFKRGEISHMVIVKSMKGFSAPKRTLRITVFQRRVGCFLQISSWMRLYRCQARNLKGLAPLIAFYCTTHSQMSTSAGSGRRLQSIL